MSNVLTQFTEKHATRKLPDVKPGDTVRVHQKIKEGDKTRSQIFEGVVIAHKHGRGLSGTIMVRKISFNVGVERVFPLHSPNIEKIEIMRRAKVRRAKLYYLRGLRGKKARMKARQFEAIVYEEPKEEVTSETEPAAEALPQEAETEQKEPKEEAPEEKKEE